MFKRHSFILYLLWWYIMCRSHNWLRLLTDQYQVENLRVLNLEIYVLVCYFHICHPLLSEFTFVPYFLTCFLPLFVSSSQLHRLLLDSLCSLSVWGVNGLFDYQVLLIVTHAYKSVRNSRQKPRCNNWKCDPGGMLLPGFFLLASSVSFLFSFLF